MPRKPRRDSWRIVEGKWTRSYGNRGARVRVFEREKGGVFYRDVYLPGRGKDRRSLGTTDRDEADRLARELLAALLRSEEIAANGKVSLRYLWDRYRGEAAGYLDNEPRTQQDDARHVGVLLAFFGEGCDVRHLTEADAQAFTAARRRGGITLPNGGSTQPVRARSAEVELRLLRTMLRWATTVRVREGQRLLAANPLAGLRGVKESSPRRPVASWERFEATRRAMQDLATANAANAQRHQQWLRMELALVIAEATGRRIGAIRKLDWSDVDLSGATIRWRAENDKKRKEWVVPIPPTLLEELRRFRVKLGGAFGGFVFPSPVIQGRPLARTVFRDALNEAERHAGLPKLEAGAWHAYRRKWASERKHLPLVDVAAAGGWKDTQTLVNCYQHADRDTMLAVMSESRKVTERAVGT